MTPTKKLLMRGALDLLYYSSAFRLLEPKWSGVGLIFTLHHIRPAAHEIDFSPNRILDITPEFLDATLRQVRQAGVDIISLDEVEQRLRQKNVNRKFAAFTIDDGYLDNFTHALPVFEKNNAPFTVYICTGLPDGQVLLWWEILEYIIQQHDQVAIRVADQSFNFDTRTTAEKYQAFNAIYWSLRKLSHEKQYAEIEKIIDQYAVDWRAMCRSCSMNWEQIREMHQHPLVTIGAHTIHHYALKKLSLEQVREEADQGRSILARQLGEEPRHFAYPYGDAGSAAVREFEIMQDLGFATSTTTRKGMLFPEHADHLQALPRVSLNGDYQAERYVRLFLSGAPFALSNKFQRLSVS